MQHGWWYAIGGQRLGPVSEAELFALLLNGEVGTDTLVWRLGRENWQPLSEVKDLAHLRNSMPPGLPPAEPVSNALLLSPASPWRRFFARHVDILLLYFPITIGGSIILRQHFLSFSDWIQKQILWDYVSFPASLFVEAIIFGVSGTTVGKALLGVRVETIRGERPSFYAYARRLVGVFWHGLAAGLPLLHLFAMWNQYGRLKRWQPADYDQGMFSVVAHPLGFWRAIAAAVLVITALTAQILIIKTSAMQGQSSVDLKWTNPTTRMVAQVPAGWTYEVKNNRVGQTIHFFISPRDDITMVFADEQISAAKTLETYGRWWILAARAEMTLEPETSRSVHGREIWAALGHKNGDELVPIRVVFAKSRTGFARVLIIGSLDGEEQVVKPAIQLLAALLDTVD